MKKLQKEHKVTLSELTKSKIIEQKKKAIDEKNTIEILHKLLFTKQQYYDKGGK